MIERARSTSARPELPVSPVRFGLLQRQCSCGQHTVGGVQCEECSKGGNERDRGDSAHAAVSVVDKAMRSPAQPLAAGTKQIMEPLFGHDFSGVRIHSNHEASQTAQALSARAFTIGRDVVFNEGEYSPATAAGQKLLAHELTHVVQQDHGGSVGNGVQGFSHPHDASEHEATENADLFSTQAPLRVRQASSGIVQGDALGIGLGIGLGAVGLGLGITGLVSLLRGGKRWSIAQANTDGANYSSDVNLTFNPTEDMNCSEIAFAQALKFSDAGTGQSVETIPNYVNRRTKAGWTFDRVDQRKYGWYGYNNDGRPSGTVSPGSAPKPLKSAKMQDTPSDSRPNSIFQFETCAVCKTGTDANKLYSAFHWGFSVDAANRLKTLSTSESDKPSKEFTDSVTAWNTQATGPAAAQNDPAQQQMGPFR